MLLGQMAHDGLVCVRAVPCGIGVCDAVEGITVTCFDGIEPCLLAREAKAGMVEPDEGANAG